MSAKARSPSGKTAWGDYGSARPDPQFDFGQEPIRDDADLSPTAMEGDDAVYMSGDRNKSTAVANTSKNQSKSCFAKIGGGIRSLWATRQTEDVKGDRELHVKTTLRELIIYIVFLVILCIVTFGMTQTTMYYYTKVMSDLFLDKTHSSGGSFRTITSVEDFWKFAKGPLVNGLYWETWYNNATVPEDQQGYIYYENKLLGVPRLRQLQVHSNSCVVHDDFKKVIRECYESYSESLENKQPFGEAVTNNNNDTAWKYQTQDELDGSSHWGKIASYSGAGYVKDLTLNKSESAGIIDDLFDKRWIRRGTRVLFIDFTVYNANINLFCVIRLTVEFPPTGGAIPHATMRTVKLIRYVTVMDYFIMACEFILCLFILYYMVEEAIEIKKHKFSYFKSVWNILDILVIVIALVCVGFNIYRTLKVDELLKKLLDKPDQYADFEFLSYGQTQFDNAIAIAVFLAWIKIFKYISFNKTMTQLSSTLGKCAKDLAGFAVMFFIIFLAFTQLGYLLFGTQVKDFSDFQNSFFTLFRIILGDFDFDQLEAANRVLGPIFFMLFVFFVFFVLINMFLAIINDTYSEVKGDMANQKNEFEMGDYFKRGYEKMLNKLNFKHDKIVDIQKALQSADINNDQQVDFDEWRQDLKTRGYADGEIEALFAKYDMDGDRVLDKEEQRKMQADLAHQRDALKKEYDELDKIDRPESARRSTSRVSFNDDSADDSDDEDSHTKSSRSGPSQSVSYEEFTVLSRRVDRMEHSIGSIVSKIDAVLVKLEAMEKAKLKRRETMGKILDSITESDGTSDEVKREQMERLVREELERWDSESSITPQASASGRGASPISSGHGARSRSGGNPQNVDNLSCEKKQCEETVKPHIFETFSKEDTFESENRLDQTELDGVTGAQCESAETGTSDHGYLYPLISVSTFKESIAPSLHYNLLNSECAPKMVHTSVSDANLVNPSLEQRTVCVTSEKTDLRPVTPILPGIPSSCYRHNVNTELELTLAKHDSEMPVTDNITSIPLKDNLSSHVSSSCVTSATEKNTHTLPQSYSHTPADSNICVDKGISSSLSALQSSHSNDNLKITSSRPTSKSSDRNNDLNTRSSRPTSKNLNRNDDSNTRSSRPTSKSSDRNDDSNTKTSRPTSKSSDRNDDSNTKTSMPTSKSSDRSDDSNTKTSRPTSKSSDRSDDSNTKTSMPTSKSSERNDDANTRPSRRTSKSSVRSDDANTRSSRPTSKSSDRNDDSKTSSSWPVSKSSNKKDDLNAGLSRPTSKSSDRNDDLNTRSSRPSSKSSDRNDDLKTGPSRQSSKSSDRNDDLKRGPSRPSSKSSDRNYDLKTGPSRPSKSSDRNDDLKTGPSRPTSKSSDRNDDLNTILTMPTSKSSDRNENIMSSKLTSINVDRHVDTVIKLPMQTSSSSERYGEPKSGSSRPISESSGIKNNPNEYVSTKKNLDDNHEAKMSVLKDSKCTVPIGSLCKADPNILDNMQTNPDIDCLTSVSNPEAIGLCDKQLLPRINDSQLTHTADKCSDKKDMETIVKKASVKPDCVTVINEKNEDLNQVSAEIDSSASKTKQTEKIDPVALPKTILTEKGQKVSRGTLSKMAGKRKGHAKNVTDNTKPHTAVKNQNTFKSNIEKSIETHPMEGKDSAKILHISETQPVEIVSSKLRTQDKKSLTANEKLPHTGNKEGKRRETSQSPLRSPGAVSVNSPVDISDSLENYKHAVFQKTSSVNDRDSKTISLPAIDFKTSKEDSGKHGKVKDTKGAKDNLSINSRDTDKHPLHSKANLTSTLVIDGQKPVIGKRPAPPRPSKQVANTGSVNAHGEGNVKSESKIHNESAVFV